VIKEDDAIALKMTSAQRDFAMQLRCLGKFTIDYVWLVVQQYSTPRALFDRMSLCYDNNVLNESKLEVFLNEFSHLKPANGVRFGPGRAIALFNHYMTTNYAAKPGAKNKPDRLVAATVATDEEKEEHKEQEEDANQSVGSDI
jgi:hypothetical protein